MNLRYRPLSDDEAFPTLDFSTDDGKDPLGVNKFFHNYSHTYRKNNLSTVWIVRDDDEPVAYFTVSMNAIEVKELEIDEKVKDATTSRYPAVLLGQMGVDKKHRRSGIALAICDFCVGLGGSVWTQDFDKAEKISRAIASGMVSVNNVQVSDPRIPFGGIKNSGIGRELSSYGMLEFVNIKSVRFYDQLIHKHFVE